MNAYCKHCRSEHAAWTRLNDGYICGLCNTRERDPQVRPVGSGESVRLPSAVAHPVRRLRSLRA
jgi:hypothetical protein